MNFKPRLIAPSTTRSKAAAVALALLVLGAASGALLATGFDASEPYRSISGWLLVRPGLAFARNVHFWSGQFFVFVFLVWLWQRLGAASAARTEACLASLAAALIPVAGALLMSGFMLRGDGNAHELWRLLGGAISGLPLVGGNASSAELDDWSPKVYLVHIAAAALLAATMWLRAGGRSSLPRPAVFATIAAVALLSLFASPGLHDGMDPYYRVPWYFVGIQHVLATAYGPSLAVGASIAVLAVLAWMPHWPAPWVARGRGGIAGAVLCYLAATLLVLLLSVDGDDASASGDALRMGAVFGVAGPASPAPDAPTAVRGRAEGCLACHGKTEGLDAAHLRIGCASCHAGDPFTLDAGRAHAGMVLVPGNLADAGRTCGQAACHAGVPTRIEHSIMTTMAGVITVDRRVIGSARGEAPPPDDAPPPDAAHLGTTAADAHLRELCVSCHLGQAKTEWGPIVQESRGGGCNACHLVYDAAGVAELTRYLAAKEAGAKREAPRRHPSLTVNPSNEHCFGCHSRSSRISSSYEGWHELRGEPPPGMDPAQVRKLDDGRYFQRVVADVHHERGLECIDCHTANEIMGIGATVARKTDQLRVGCADCHAPRLASIAPDALDPESRKLMQLRNWTPMPGKRVGATHGGEPLVNVLVDADGRGHLLRKRTGQVLELKPPAAACTEGKAHANVSCVSCHSAWAPRCTTCHTEFDPKGEGFDHLAQKWIAGTWNETSGAFDFAPPTLGIRLQRDTQGREHATVETFVPGMILSVDRNRSAGQPPDTIFRRLYGMTFAHTIRREPRTCRSCHTDPVALGYGRGRLHYEVRAASGRWRFEPKEPLLQDGLPADAWIGFLGSRDGMVSTRDDVRPFTVAEQQRILRVGACLTCHRDDSAVMAQAIADFQATLARRRPGCVLPEWP